MSIFLITELQDALKTHYFRGSWIPIDKNKNMDIISVVQAYTQYNAQTAKKHFKKIQQYFNDDDISVNSFQRFKTNIDTIIKILAFFQPSTTQNVKEYVANTFGGQMNVLCKWGNIDVLSDSSMYVINEVDQWEYALGRILTYSSSFPNHTPVLVVKMDKKCDDDIIDHIKDNCYEYDISLLKVYEKHNKLQHKFMGGCEVVWRRHHAH